MEVKTRLNVGPVEVEITAEEGEEYEEEILSVLQFLRENRDEFGLISPPKHEIEGDDSEPEDEEAEPDDVEKTAEPDALEDLATTLRISEDTVKEVFILDSQPMLFLDDYNQEEVLGEKKTERQRRASLMLLYLWHEYLDEERVKSGELKDAIQMSGISETSLANIYQGEGETLFDRAGRGPTATVALTPPGIRRARKMIKQFIETVEQAAIEEEEETEESETAASMDDFL